MVFPNPFNPTARIAFTLPFQAEVRIRIFDARGRLVCSFNRRYDAAGEYWFTWDARDERGVPLPSGVYLIQLEVVGPRGEKHTFLVRKVTLLR